MVQFNPASTLFFLCDLQTKFRPAIFAFDHVVNTTNKLLKLAKILGIEVVATTQNTRALGPIDPAIDLLSLGDLHLGTFDKTLFSMLTADVKRVLDSRPHIKSVVLFGIESHICITQTSLSLLELPARIKPYVVADGVSSTNAHEIPLALDRLRQEGVIVATSESLAFQLIGDAGRPEFKAFSALVKQEKEKTTAALLTLLGVYPCEFVGPPDALQITSKKRNKVGSLLIHANAEKFIHHADAEHHTWLCTDHGYDFPARIKSALQLRIK